MKRPITRSLAAACCAALLAHAGNAQTSAEQGLMPYLPADTMLAFSTPDMNTAWEQFQQMPLAKMWEEKQVQEFLAGPMQRLDAMIGMQMGMLRQQYEEGIFPIDPDSLMAMRPKSMTLAMTRFAMTAGPGGRPNPEVGILLHLDAGAGGAVLHQVVDIAMAMLSGQDEALELVAKQVGDVQTMSLLPPAQAGIAMGLHVAKVPGGLLVGTLANEFEATLKAMLEGTPVLGTSAAYQQASGPLGMADRSAEMFMQTQQVVDMAMGMAELLLEMEGGPEPMIDMAGLYRGMDALGLAGMGATAMRMGYENGRGLTRSFTVSPEEERTGLMKAMDDGVNTEFLAWVPKDAVSVSSFNLDPAAIYDTIIASMDAYQEGMGQMMGGLMAQMKEQTGVDLEQDLLRAFGQNFSMWAMPNSQLLAPPEVVLLVEVKNPDGILKALRTLDEMTGEAFDLRSNERRGVESHQVRLNMDLNEMANQGPLQINPLEFLQPTFGFHKGYMVVGFAAGDVRRAIKRMDRAADEQTESILDNEEFAAMFERVQGRSVTSIAWADNRNMFKGYYQGLVGMLGFIPMGADSPVNLSLIPDYDTLGQHLFATQTWTETTPEGFMSFSEGPFGPELAVLAAIGIGAGASAGIMMGGRMESDFTPR